jgi:hypothetical protein
LHESEDRSPFILHVWGIKGDTQGIATVPDSHLPVNKVDKLKKRETLGKLGEEFKNA